MLCPASWTTSITVVLAGTFESAKIPTFPFTNLLALLCEHGLALVRRLQPGVDLGRWRGRTVYAQGYSDSGQTVIFTFPPAKPARRPTGSRITCVPASTAWTPMAAQLRTHFTTPLRCERHCGTLFALCGAVACKSPSFLSRMPLSILIAVDGSPENITWAFQCHPLFPRYVPIMGDKDGE